ncbi:MAG TPA: amidohydrolase family protein [Candidatus Dormibacteraeota bacterium]|nr:amidohydrolase family protein [Candidatus Dormibacteraeota bacterium]
MRTIALEEHITTPALLEAFTAGTLGAPSEYVRTIQAKLLDLGAGRLADMDADGIDVQVLSLAVAELDRLEPATATSLVREANDLMAAAVRAHPTRLAAFAAIHLRQPEKAATELERCIRILGFKGALVNGTSEGLFLDDPRFTPFWEAAHSLAVPVYLHPAPPPDPVRQAYFSGLPGDLAFFLSTAAWGWHAETGLHVLRLIVSGLFDRFPGLQVIIGHMGENLPFSLARADTILARSRSPLQRRVAEYAFQHLHLTTSGYFTLPPLLCALQVFGADRILFSVDYPYSRNAQGRAFLDALPLSPADLNKIAHANAERLLKLPSR